jgi:chromosome segregation protein
LARQREIEALQIEASKQNQQVASVRDRLTLAEQHHQETDLKIAPLRMAGNEMQQRLHGLQMNILKLTQSAERSAERVVQIDQEIQEMAELLMNEQMQMQVVDEQMADLREHHAAFFAQIDEAQRNANTQNMALREQRGHAQHAQHALQEARFFDKTCKEKIADLQHGIAQAAATLSQLELNLIGLDEELTSSADEDVQSQLQQALQARQVTELALAEARNALEHAAVSDGRTQLESAA